MAVYGDLPYGSDSSLVWLYHIVSLTNPVLMDIWVIYSPLLLFVLLMNSLVHVSFCTFYQYFQGLIFYKRN